jgi:Oxidoreductase family, NAD-binding Rossmann fold
MITAVIVGAGHRVMVYASLAKQNPEKLKIVGVADPNKQRQQMVAEMYGFSEEFCFDSAEELAKQDKIADGSFCEPNSVLAGLCWAADIAYGGNEASSRLEAQFKAITGGSYKKH